MSYITYIGIYVGERLRWKNDSVVSLLFFTCNNTQNLLKFSFTYRYFIYAHITLQRTSIYKYIEFNHKERVLYLGDKRHSICVAHVEETEDGL